MKRVLSAILALAIVIAIPVVFAEDVFGTELTLCTGEDVYSVDIVCSVSALTDIVDVKITVSDCISDWNYVEAEGRLYISLASASPIQLERTIATVTAADDVKIEAESVVINGDRRIAASEAHTEIDIPRQEEAETSPGYSAGTVCSVCGAVIEAPRELPTVTLHPRAASYRVGKPAREMKVDATIGDGSELSYEWFKNDVNSNEGGISVGFGKTYTPSTDEVGVTYYYAVVTSVSEGSKHVADTRTDVVAIKVLPESDSMILLGEVTSYNPADEVKVSLVVDGEASYTVTIPSSSGSGIVTREFCFEDIAPGVYDLVITKAGHLSYTVTDVSVDGDIDLREHENALISNIALIAGDANGDGCVDLKDVTMLTSSNTYGKTYDEAVNTLADINGDGCFDLKDLTIITSDKHYGKAPVAVAY